LADGRRDGDGEAQEASYFQRRAEQTVERLATRIPEHKHDPTAVTAKLERPRSPRPVQLILQTIFVSEAIERGRYRMLPGGRHGEHCGAVAIGAPAPCPAEDAFAVLP
jgi:hypothetical protein